jgi:hypothetical protein
MDFCSLGEISAIHAAQSIQRDKPYHQPKSNTIANGDIFRGLKSQVFFSLTQQPGVAVGLAATCRPA